MEQSKSAKEDSTVIRQQILKDFDERVIGYQKDPDYYFDSYSHFNIHEEMIKDDIRTKAYMLAIKKNPHLFRDKIVLDVGSGTGILSIFAAQAGAKHVYAVEKANIYKHSRRIIEENGLQDRITVINARIEDVELPVKEVDIIISEWMGYFLLYQSMLDCVLMARDKWLAPDGLMFPDRAELYVALIEDSLYYKKKVNFWDDVHGISMKCLKKWVLSDPMVDCLHKSHIISKGELVLNINLYKVKVEELDFRSHFQLKVTRPNFKMHGLVSWFDVHFSHGDKHKVLSTSPFRDETHWKQTVFYIENPFDVDVGDCIKGELLVKKAHPNPRQLEVLLTFKHLKQVKPQQEQKAVQQFYRIT